MTKEHSFSLRSLLDKEKLKCDGINFMNWHRNLQIVLRHKKKYILTEVPPNKPSDKAEKSVREKYNKFIDDELHVSCLMVTTMSSELQLRDSWCVWHNEPTQENVSREDSDWDVQSHKSTYEVLNAR
jgi:hypothetical protein